MEKWLDIPGYEGHYQASTHGRLRALRRLVTRGDRKYFCAGGPIKAQPHNKGYLMAHLYLGTKRTKVFVHRIVAMTFIPNPDGHPIVNHKDRDRTNNRLENLEWLDESGNQLHWREDERLRGLQLSVVVIDEMVRAEDLPF